MTTSLPKPGAAQLIEEALFELKRVVVGQDRMIERTLVGLLARGHVLLEGVPGLAKTLTVHTLATVVGGTFARIQFTPDLVPSDLVGTRIYRPSQENFDIEWGPIFRNIVLADEINRAPAKVQSALLEVMAERHVSIAGTTRSVPEPFLVLATQNPIESEGVYPLPEAQRDRFLLHVTVGHPTQAEELEIVRRMSVDAPVPRTILDAEKLLALQVDADRVFVHHAVADYAVRLVIATREPAAFGLTDIAPHIALGASPRASLGLVRAGRALALIRGRSYLLPQDVFDVAPEVMRHRLILSYDALADGVTAEHVLARLLGTVPAPRVAPSQDADGRTTVEAIAWSNTYAAPTTAAVQARAVALRKLELMVTRRLDGLLAGDHHSLLRGAGTELAGGRPYEPGDDVRRMEWNLTARLGDPHVRETEADRELETWMVVDTSASLDFGTADCEKRDLAMAAVAAIGFLTARAGNRLGAVLCGGDQLTVVPARAGRGPMAALLGRLYDSPRRTTPPADRADLTAALQSLHRQRRRRGQVVVVSDFADRTDWSRPLSHLVLRHQTLAIEVRDRREDELPNVGLLALVDPETGARLEVPTGSRRVRERFSEAAMQRRVDLQHTLRRAGAQHLVLATDRDWLLDVARFVQSSRRRAGGLTTPVAR